MFFIFLKKTYFFVFLYFVLFSTLVYHLNHRTNCVFVLLNRIGTGTSPLVTLAPLSKSRPIDCSRASFKIVFDDDAYISIFILTFWLFHLPLLSLEWLQYSHLQSKPTWRSSSFSLFRVKKKTTNIMCVSSPFRIKSFKLSVTSQ